MPIKKSRSITQTYFVVQGISNNEGAFEVDAKFDTVDAADQEAKRWQQYDGVSMTCVKSVQVRASDVRVWYR